MELKKWTSTKDTDMKDSFTQSPKLLMVSPTDAERADRWRFVAVMSALFAVGGWLAAAAMVVLWIYR